MQHDLYVDVLCWTVLWHLPVLGLGFCTVHVKNVTHFYYYVYHVIDIIHLRRTMICRSIVTQVRLGGEVGTQDIELEGITKGRYILNYTTAKMKTALLFRWAAESNNDTHEI